MAQPAQGMPPAAIFAPDVYAQQLKLDRQRKLADLLQQQAMESPQGQMVSGHYIAPSATQHLARLAAIVGGNYINSKLDESQAKVSKEYGRAMAGQIDNMFGGDSQPAYIEKGSDWQPAPATTSPSASVPPPQIDRLRNAAKAAYLMGNTDLANKLIGNMLELTNDQKNMAAMGQDPFEMGRLGMAKARKEGIMEMQPGARAVDLATGVSVFNPKVAEGITLDANGFASQVPGYAAANAGIQGAQTQAQEQAKAGMDMVTINTPNGPMMVTRAQAAQMANPSPTQNIQFKGSNADLDLQGMSPDRAAQMAEGIKDPAEKARFLSTLGQWANQGSTPGIKLKDNPQIPESAVKEQQALLEKIGTVGGINADLQAIENQIETGKLKLGMVSNLAGSIKNFTGQSDEQSRNLASFKSTLEKMRNDSLRLNNGVQTEGDAVRAWNEIMANINDPALVKQRLGEIRKINERAANLHQLSIDTMRGNFSAPSLNTKPFYNQPPAVGGGFKILGVE